MGSKMIDFNPPFADTKNSPADNDFEETRDSHSTAYREVQNAAYSIQFSRIINTPTNHTEQEKKHHTPCRHLLVAFICGVVVAVVIVVPTVYFTTRNKTSHPASYHLPIKFDKSTQHYHVYMSSDRLKLSNVYSKKTPITPPRLDGPLSEYSGVIADRCFNANEKVYFEINYQFRVINLNKHDPLLLFEVGVAERNKIDNYHYVGTSEVGGCSYHLHNCNRSVCLAAQHKDEDEFIPEPLHSGIPRREYRGVLGFVVNMNRKEFTVVLRDNSHTIVVHTFHHVVTESELCPVFAVYNANTIEVQISMTNAYDFSTLPYSFVAM